MSAAVIFPYLAVIAVTIEHVLRHCQEQMRLPVAARKGRLRGAG
jgi:hypothetical protein